MTLVARRSVALQPVCQVRGNDHENAATFRSLWMATQAYLWASATSDQHDLRGELSALIRACCAHYKIKWPFDAQVYQRLQKEIVAPVMADLLKYNTERVESLGRAQVRLKAQCELLVVAQPWTCTKKTKTTTEKCLTARRSVPNPFFCVVTVERLYAEALGLAEIPCSFTGESMESNFWAEQEGCYFWGQDAERTLWVKRGDGLFSALCVEGLEGSQRIKFDSLRPCSSSLPGDGHLVSDVRIPCGPRDQLLALRHHVSMRFAFRRGSSLVWLFSRTSDSYRELIHLASELLHLQLDVSMTLGEGSSARVLRGCTQTRRVAAKTRAGSDAYGELKSEFIILASLPRHPNIVEAFCLLATAEGDERNILLMRPYDFSLDDVLSQAEKEILGSPISKALL